MNKLRVFEAFSGYGSQSIALERINANFEVVGISEIDKYALEAYRVLHKKCPNYGDISKLTVEEIPEHDLLTYSFPCQDISTAGKQKGLEVGTGTRSSLLWECQRIISSKKPKFLLMENVKNLISKRHKPYFDKWCVWLQSQGYTNYWKCLNAKDFNIPQNRERIFMVSILGVHNPYIFPNKKHLTFLLKDFLETNVSDKYYLPEHIQQKFIKSLNTNLTNTSKINENLKHNSLNNFSELKNGAIRGRYNPIGKIEQQLELRNDSCCNTLTTVQKDNVILEPNIRTLGLLDMNSFKENRIVYSPLGISPTLTTMQGGNRQPKVFIDNSYLRRIRKMTEREVGRLMGLTDTQINMIQAAKISATQQYKMYGNSIVIPVLEAIFISLLKDYGYLKITKGSD